MSVPTYDQLIEPVLRFIAALPGGATAGEAHEAAALTLGLSEAQRQETIASGKATYKNRSGWAHDRLKRANYSSSAKRGYWQLTDTGRAFAQANPAPLSADQVEHRAVNFMSVKLKTAPDAASLDESNDTSTPIAQTDLATSSPQERLNQAILTSRTSVAGDLLDSPLQASPTRFKHIVLDVLHSLGYGANRQALRKVGGIDGVISLDALELEKSTCRPNAGRTPSAASTCKRFMAPWPGRKPNAVYSSPLPASPPRPLSSRARSRGWCWSTANPGQSDVRPRGGHQLAALQGAQARQRLL